LTLALDKPSGDRANLRATLDLDSPSLKGSINATTTPTLASLNAVDAGAVRENPFAVSVKLSADHGAALMTALGLDDAVAVDIYPVALAAGDRVLLCSDGLTGMVQPDEIAAMVHTTQETLGSLDILVNNAGIQFTANVEDFPTERWDAIIAIDLASAFHTIRAALPGMKARRWGRIINVASAHALVASPFKSAYVTSKHGLLGLTKTVALEAAESGVTVNAICPGYVLTPLVEKQIPETAKARGITEEAVIRDVLLHAQPTRRFVTVSEVGGLALFLCTAAAASITGTALPIDGGWVAQ